MTRILLLLVCLLLSACTTLGPGQFETATVVSVSYTPPTHSSGVGLVGNKVGTVFSSTPEVYTVILRCDQHRRTFVLHEKKFFEICAPGTKVEVLYHEKLDNNGNVVGYETEQIRAFN